jgi:transcription initiation factor TFIIIB Brf1 subunit/transcription initiation factor TFIIB
MGKNLLVLAAAALYLATVEDGLNIAKTMIADAAEMSTISLRKRRVIYYKGALESRKKPQL